MIEQDGCERAAPISKEPEHVAHYPLDISLPFDIYHHRPIATRDIMIHNIMADFMSPSRVKPRTYDAYITYPAEFDQIKSQNQQLGTDLKVMRKMLLTSNYHDPPAPGKPRLHRTTWEFSRHKQVLKSIDQPVEGPVTAPPTIGEEVIDLVQRYLFETDGAIARLWVELAKPPRKPEGPRPSRNGVRKPRVDARERFDTAIEDQQCRERKKWLNGDTQHLKMIKTCLTRSDELLPNSENLYDGGGHLALIHRAKDGDMYGERLSRPILHNYHYTLASRFSGSSRMSSILWRNRLELGIFIQPRWSHRRQMDYYCRDAPHAGGDRITGRGRPKTRSSSDDQPRSPFKRPRRRTQSEPPRGSYCSANLPESPEKDLIPGNLMVMFCRLPLSTIDRRTRRRSLSRTHIADMFDWDCEGMKAPERPAADIERQKKNSQHARKRTRRLGRIARDLQNADLADAPSIISQLNQSPPDPSPFLDEYYLYPPCPNCTSRSHPLSECEHQCGYCGAPNPLAFSSSFQTTIPRPLSSRRPDELGDVAETVIKIAEGSTIILKGEDRVFLCRDSNIIWLSAAPRDKVVFSAGLIDAVNRGPLPVGQWLPTVEELREQPTGERQIVAMGPGVHGHPHLADKCPVQKGNRCKCVGFPQWHTAERCRVLCSRGCGGEGKRGSWGHRNAMGCKARCCMCGIRGHSGRECRLERCRCGGRHLGQDCTWKVECRVPACGRYRCGVHCTGCGGVGRPFVRGLCEGCRGVEAGETVGSEKKERNDGDGATYGGRATRRGRQRAKKLATQREQRAENDKQDALSQAQSVERKEVIVEKKVEVPRSSIFGGP